jgi:HEAT repeat protein
MGSVFKGIEKLGAARLVLEAILVSLMGIFLLVGFIVLRRWYRARYFHKRNRRTVALRSQWNDILSGKIPAEDWRFNALDCDIVESILLDSIEMSPAEELPPLLDCLRVSGLLDMRIYEARTSRGLKQRTALLALGRTRSMEAVPALTSGLDSPLRETRIAAVRGLGRTARMEAAIPILDRIVTGRFDAPERSLKNALVNCCRFYPEVLINYVEQTQGPVRELLARVLGELASPELGEELLVLASDALPEVRASAARALGNTNASYTLPALHSLAVDPEWFVRLRAVVALGQIENIGKINILLRSLCDANRHVRQRAAWALARMEPQLDQILEDVIATKDDYALQAFVSELERSGAIEKIVSGFADSGHHSAETALMEVVAEARKRVELTGKAAAATVGAH